MILAGLKGQYLALRLVLLVTRHLQMDALRPVSALSPGVLGTTGLESAEIVRGVVERVRPARVVVADALISIPTVLIALILSVPFGASAAVVIAACGCAYGLNLARILRPSALLAARSAYVESALWSGASSVRVFFTHIVPNTLPVLCVQLSMSAGTSLLAEAGLTYLGVGVGAGVPSWGHSLSTSVKFISIYPMAVLWPGLVVTMVVVALNLFGDALRDALDPLTNPALREAA